MLTILLVASTLIPMLSASAASVPDILADNGLPVVNITIDESVEGYGTIEEMNASPNHSVECTGSVKITVPDGYTGDYSDSDIIEIFGDGVIRALAPGITTVSGGAVATGENVTLIFFFVIIAAAGIVLYYYSCREK